MKEAAELTLTAIQNKLSFKQQGANPYLIYNNPELYQEFMNSQILSLLKNKSPNPVVGNYSNPNPTFINFKGNPNN